MVFRVPCNVEGGSVVDGIDLSKVEFKKIGSVCLVESISELTVWIVIRLILLYSFCFGTVHLVTWLLIQIEM